MRLTDERYEQIKTNIGKLFIKYGVSSLPISSFEIAIKMGIKVVPYSSKSQNLQNELLKTSEDGFSWEKRRGEWSIYYNDKKNYGRINNTIMHEIGHITLNHSQSSELAETEAKFFAKYALAPPVLIHKSKLADFMEIADFFGISYEAAKYAYSYYQKRVMFGTSDFTDYEKEIISMFDIVV